MSIRLQALQWLGANYGNVVGPVYTSKFYRPDESWPKEHVWWLQIPLKKIDSKENAFINLICQVASKKKDFHYLKVPTHYFQKHLGNLHIVDGKASLYLSADAKNLFIETRGEGKTEFAQFVVLGS